VGRTYLYPLVLNNPYSRLPCCARVILCTRIGAVGAPSFEAPVLGGGLSRAEGLKAGAGGGYYNYAYFDHIQPNIAGNTRSA